MADVDQVVDFRSVADAGDSEGGAIDAGVGSDFYAITDLHSSDLRKLFVHAVGEDETESVGADHAAGMQNYVIADFDVAINGDARMERAVVADMHVIADDGSGANGRAGGDADSGSDGRPGGR